MALIWKSETDDGMDDWSAATVGEIEMVAGKDLADKRPDYAELAKADAEIPTIVLNRTYSPLKAYVQARAVELTDEGKEQSRDRYAVGVGVALLVLDQQARKAEKAGAVSRVDCRLILILAVSLDGTGRFTRPVSHQQRAWSYWYLAGPAVLGSSGVASRHLSSAIRTACLPAGSPLTTLPAIHDPLGGTCSPRPSAIPG